MLEEAYKAGNAAEIGATMKALKKQRQAKMAADRKEATLKRRALKKERLEAKREQEAPAQATSKKPKTDSSDAN